MEKEREKKPKRAEKGACNWRPIRFTYRHFKTNGSSSGGSPTLYVVGVAPPVQLSAACTVWLVSRYFTIILPNSDRKWCNGSPVAHCARWAFTSACADKVLLKQLSQLSEKLIRTSSVTPNRSLLISWKIVRSELQMETWSTE